MGKRRKKRSRQGDGRPADQRPGQLVAFLAIWCVSILVLLYLWYFYMGVVGGNSLPVPAQDLPLYRGSLLATAAFALLIWLLLFFGLKAGFWMAVAFVSLDLLSRILTLRLNIILDALYLYLLLCPPTRAYFRVGQFKTLGPRAK